MLLHPRSFNPVPVVGLHVSALGSSCHHNANSCLVAHAIHRLSTPLGVGSQPEQPSVGEWPHGWLQLDYDNKWKRFYDYWRRKGAEATRNSSFITFAYDEKGEEDPEHRLPLVARTKSKIIVRDCYRLFYDCILKLRNSSYNGLVLSGQPGTGASSSRLLVSP